MPLLEVMQKKLRETQYFLRQMEAVAKRPVGDEEEFEFLLSALLSASRSITKPLESRRYKPWYDAWRNGRTRREQELLEFMRVQRIAEVHQDGAAVEVAVEFVPLTELRTDRQGHPAYGFRWWGPSGIPPPAVGVIVHQFELGGTQVEAFGTCRDLVAVLGALVAAYEVAHPGA
jgi:hypothetical protein